ncbi:PEP/pyruvate-binding domain-containing protein [Nitratidesulfovibrio sp. 1201_IL3209]|uniref:PEP/pyruvate-binding domain-containing protein n=1 Tax=Nitratidesulfovibrio sp. 1201_IL3209 TaxID=3084053 RepID=UPI002FDADA9A
MLAAPPPVSLLDRLRSLFGRRRAVDAESRERVMRVFRARYAHFKDLLDSNAELARILADMDEKIAGCTLFGATWLRSQATRAVFHAMRMVTGLNAISNDAYPALPGVVERINAEITGLLESRPQATVDAYALPFAEINGDMVDWVGGKCANLGELTSRVGVPVPRGFAITTRAYYAFMEHDGLMGEIRKRLREVDPQDPESVLDVAEDIQDLFAAATVPPDVVDALRAACDAAFGPPGPDEADGTEGGGAPLRLAVRSSALSEDSHVSFAGQYLSVLNVSRDGVVDAWKRVVASLFMPQAIVYRLHQGITLDASAMAVACMEMVDSVAAGVLFTRHPVDLLSDSMVINAAWGLGAAVVDGEMEPDTWLFSREEAPHPVSRHIVCKAHRLAPGDDGRLREEDVPEPQRDAPCLTDAQAAELARIGMRVEAHYGVPQDVEWALDPAGRLLLLQARPLTTTPRGDARTTPLMEGYPLLLHGGEPACPGVGCGPVLQPRDAEELALFPEGGILVAMHSSPSYVLVMQRAQAIVAEAGSITGHMASLAREFGVPTIVNAPGAMAALPVGTLVTVDAFSCRVYEGRVEELLPLREERAVCLRDTPIHNLLKQVAALVSPLNLHDPKSDDFTPAACRTLHDVMRFVHELSYAHMFRLSDTVSDAGAVAVEMKAPVPLDLHVIDLGGGLTGVDGPYAWPEQVVSAPFRALLDGMLDPAVHQRGPRPVDMSGFLSVMSRHMIEPPTMHGQRFGDRSYALVSDKYLNFSSRVGYHYGVLDAYCGQTMNKNYITFQFKGGAADETRKNRRVRCIGIILESIGFQVEVRGDMVTARFQKFAAPQIAERLVQLGRLLIVTRQLDMLMVDEAAVQRFAENFLNGHYH